MENYQVLKQFKFKHSAQANEKAFVKGKHYRFTVLTGRLIRMEYSPRESLKTGLLKPFGLENNQFLNFKFLKRVTN